MPSLHFSYSLWSNAAEAALLKLPPRDTTTAICWWQCTFCFLVEWMQRSEAASLYFSGIAATSAMNNLLQHWLMPSSHRGLLSLFHHFMTAICQLIVALWLIFLPPASLATIVTTCRNCCCQHWCKSHRLFFLLGNAADAIVMDVFFL